MLSISDRHRNFPVKQRAKKGDQPALTYTVQIDPLIALLLRKCFSFYLL